jgi:predicted permease
MVLFFFILRRLLPNKNWAFALSLIYAIHPIHIESVTYLAGRGDTLYLLFLMISFLSFLKRDDQRFGVFWTLLSCLAFLLSIFTKENGFSFPLVLGLFYLTLKIGQKRSAWLIIGSQILTAIAYFLWRNPLTGEGNGALSLINEASFLERIFTGPYILLTYLRLLVVPFPLHMEYHHVVTSPLSWWSLGILGILFLSWKYFRSEVTSPRFLMGLGWFLLALAPVSQIVMPLASTVREHWATFPYMGLFIWLGYVGSEKIPSMTRNVTIILCMVVMLIGGLTLDRNIDWKDPMRLYLHDLSYEPNSFVLQNNVGVIAFRNGDMGMARDYFLRAINVSPGNAYGTAHNNYAAVLEREGNIALASFHYRKSVEYSQYELGYVNLARLMLKGRKSKEVIDLLEEGVSRYKNNIDILYLLASAYYLEKDFLKAKQLYTRVQTLSPGFLVTESMLQRIQDKGY